MVIRGRAGRARFTTNPRATVREHPAPQEEATVRKSRKIDSPADLVKVCEDAGAQVRPTSKGGHLVHGPLGTTVIPARWAHGRGQDNVIAKLRKTGVNLAEAQHALLNRRPANAAAGRRPPKLVTAGARPALAHDTPSDLDPERQLMPTAPSLMDMPDQRSLVPAKDVDALLDELAALAARVDTLAGRMDALSDGLAAQAARSEETGRELKRPEKALSVGPIVYDRTREARERIEAWFRQLPAGMRVPAGVVTGNLCAENDEATVTMYRRQLTRMVELGQLEQHGGTSGCGGSKANYSLPPVSKSSVE